MVLPVSIFAGRVQAARAPGSRGLPARSLVRPRLFSVAVFVYFFFFAGLVSLLMRFCLTRSGLKVESFLLVFFLNGINYYTVENPEVL